MWGLLDPSRGRDRFTWVVLTRKVFRRVMVVFRKRVFLQLQRNGVERHPRRPDAFMPSAAGGVSMSNAIRPRLVCVWTSGAQPRTQFAVSARTTGWTRKGVGPSSTSECFTRAAENHRPIPLLYRSVSAAVRINALCDSANNASQISRIFAVHIWPPLALAYRVAHDRCPA